MSKKKKKQVARPTTTQKPQTPRSPVHVGIFDSVNLRRQILETSRDSLLLISEFSKLDDLQKQKRKAFEEFDKLVDDLKGQMQEIKSSLPVQTIRSEVASVHKHTSKPSVHRAHLTELESELADIESKLNELA